LCVHRSTSGDRRRVTEAHLFITDLNQSPFNVGTRLTLEDFTCDQVADLNRRYGSPLRHPSEVARLFHLVGGQPYLVRRGLHELVTRGLTIGALEDQANREDRCTAVDGCAMMTPIR